MKHLISACLSGIFFTAGVFSVHAAAPPQLPPPSVVVEKVQERSACAEKRYVGRVGGTKEVSLPARVSGMLMASMFKEGAMVKKGDILFRIEDTTYRAQVDACSAKLAQCQAEYDYTKHNYERQHKLFLKKAVSEQVNDEANRAYLLAKGKCEEAKANLLDAQNSLSYTVIKAPMDGRIGKIQYSSGNYVTPSSGMLAKLIMVDPIRVQIAMSERDLLELFGTPDSVEKLAIVRVTLANHKEYPHIGSIIIVDNKIDEGTGTLTMWASFKNPDNQLIPGGFVTAYISRKCDKARPAIHLSALLTDRDGNYVYVVGADGVAVRRNVKPGEIIGSWQLLEQGLEPGETVVVDGTHKVIPGGKVIPVPAAAAGVK